MHLTTFSSNSSYIVLPIFTHNYYNYILKDNNFLQYSFYQSSNSSRTWLDNLRCIGTERILTDCPANTIGVEDCTHAQDVALVCTVGKLDDNYSDNSACMCCLYYSIALYLQFQ